MFVVQPPIHKICTREIFVRCIPDWRALDVLLSAIELWHCYVTSSRSTATFLTLPAHARSVDNSPPAIQQANLDVLAAEKEDASAKTRAQELYDRLTDRQRAQIGK